MSKRKPTPKQQKSPPPNKTGFWQSVKSLSWFIFAISVLLYANTLFHNYTIDDAIVIYDNEFTTKGIAGIPDLLKYDSFRGFFKTEGKDQLVAGGRYRPLTSVMYAIEVQLFAPAKKDANGVVVTDKDGHKVFDPNQNWQLNTVKFMGHLVNVLLFAFTGVLLFWLLLKWFPNGMASDGPAGKVPFVALATALLFAVHPIHTEAVANIKGRDEIVSLLGSLAALYLSFRAFQEKKEGLNVLAGLLFFLALLSKENAITFLAVMPLSFYFFSKAQPGRIFSLMVPYLAAAALFLVIRGSVLGWNLGGELPGELMNNPFRKLVGNQYVDFTAGEKFATIFFTLGKYVQLLVFPHPLTHDYYPRVIGIMKFSDWQVIGSVLLYIGMGIYALVRLPKKDPVSYGILFYLATLSIASNIVFPIGTNMSERFVYMPSAGFFLVVAMCLQRWAKFGKPLMIAGTAVLLALGGKTFLRNLAWKDNFTLFKTDIAASKNSAKLRNALGAELTTQAILPENAARKTEMLNEAIPHLQEAIRIHPGYKNPFLVLGNVYNYLQQYEVSIENYQKALQLDPNFWEAKNNIAITYRDAGRFYGEQKGDLNKALEYLQLAYQRKPDDYETNRLLGVAYGITGDIESAIRFFTKGTELAPEDAEAWFNLGIAYLNAGQQEKGQEFIQKAKSINPNIEAERSARQ